MEEIKIKVKKIKGVVKQSGVCICWLLLKLNKEMSRKKIADKNSRKGPIRKHSFITLYRIPYSRRFYAEELDGERK